MPRDPQNPVKMRAMRRARELGKTLGQVYREADCNKAYLTEVPKTGWRENKLQAIAKALAWTIDELMRDDEDDRKTDNSDLLEMAIDVAAELLERAGGTRAKPPELAWATRLIYEVLREIAAGGGQIDRQSVMIWGRRLIAALRTDSTSSG